MGNGTMSVHSVKKGSNKNPQRNVAHARVVNLTKTQTWDVDISRTGPWGNPFKLRAFTRRASIRLHRIWFMSRLQTEEGLWDAFMDLQGKILACYCKPKKCHGDLYVTLLNKLGSRSR